MAHRPVGSATSLGITKTSTASTDFAVQSNVIRVTARQTHAFVAIGTAANPTASSADYYIPCLLYTSPSPRDVEESRMPSSA